MQLDIELDSKAWTIEHNIFIKSCEIHIFKLT